MSKLYNFKCALFCNFTYLWVQFLIPCYDKVVLMVCLALDTEITWLGIGSYRAFGSFCCHLHSLRCPDVLLKIVFSGSMLTNVHAYSGFLLVLQSCQVTNTLLSSVRDNKKIM